ncbi:MAG: 23S rRNA (adenine(2503)-C(2))-methyltransferase RlmN [Bacillota bacterium]
MGGRFPAELEAFCRELGQPAFRGRQMANWIWRQSATSFEEMTNLPASLRQQLDEVATVELPTVLSQRSAISGDTTKLLLRLEDGETVETVLLRHTYGNSLCLSTQVGCAMGCRFCASAIGGLVRNLAVHELAGQVRRVNRILDENRERPVTHIVLMGTGEPLSNYDNVLTFIRLVSSAHTLQISPRRVTLSTAGVVPGICRLAGEGLPVTLAISLHAPNDTLRDQLVPLNRVYPVREVLSAARHYGETTGRRVTVEYALIEGMNDRLDQARELAELLLGGQFHVNLIPLNPVDEYGWRGTGQQQQQAFLGVLQDLGLSATIRREMGADIDAACGQLRRGTTRG